MHAHRRIDWGRRQISPGLPAAAVIATLGLVLAAALAPFVAGLLGALVLAVAFAPLSERLSRRLSPATAAVVVLAVAVALILIPGFCIGALLVRAVPQAVTSADLAPIVTRLDSLEFRGIAIGSEIAKAGGALASWGSQRVFVIAGGAARAAVNLVIAFFGLYYLLVSGESAWAEFSKYSPFSATTTERLRGSFATSPKQRSLALGSAPPRRP
ncbi:MAG: AI-2E family transporter [Gemmatimonadaceae bacterium]